MLLMTFKCQSCNHRIEAEVVDKDEPRERDLPTSPVACPRCRCTWIETLQLVERRARRAS